MDEFAQTFSVNTLGPECPECGAVYEDDGDYTYHGSDGEGFDITCEECGLEFEAICHIEYSWHADHPFQCGVQGYHVPYISKEHNKHQCLYCQTKLDCDCVLHDRCTHKPTKKYKRK